MRPGDSDHSRRVKRHLLFLAALGLAGAALGLRAAAAESPATAPLSEAPIVATAHLLAPADFRPWDAASLQALEAKLADFERTQHVRILVRFHAKSPTGEEDKVPGAYMRALSTKLGTIEGGVLVVYFLDEPDWRMWLADSLTPKFTGKSGTAKELTKSGAIHDAKEAFFAEVTAKANAAFTPGMKVPDPKQYPANHPKRLALHAEAMVDGLIARLGTK